MSAALKALARLVAPEGESSAPLALQLQAIDAECVEAFGPSFKHHEMAGCIVLSVWTARQWYSATPPVGPRPQVRRATAEATPRAPVVTVASQVGPHVHAFAGNGAACQCGVTWEMLMGDVPEPRFKPVPPVMVRVGAARDADLGQRAIAQLLKHEYSAGTVDGSSVCAECGAAKYARDAQGHTSDEPEPHKAGCEWGALVEFAKQGAAP